MNSVIPIEIRRWLCLVALICAPFTAAAEETTGALTLNEAVAMALESSPRLEAFGWDIRAADARVLQASLRPNPELTIDIEEVRWTSGPNQRTRSGAYNGAFERGIVSLPTGQPNTTIDVPGVTPGASAGFDVEREQGARSGFAESEFTLSISQLIELGRKRAKRVALANREKELAQWDYEAARADVIADTAMAFTEVLADQANLDLQRELVELATDVARSIGLRVKAGQVSPLENNRAEVALAATRIRRDRAVREIAIARARLAANWGSTNVSFSKVVGRLDEVIEVPPLETLLDEISRNPDLARWATELATRDAQLTLARAQRIPDPTLLLGLRSTGLGNRSSTQFGADTGWGFGVAHNEIDFDRRRDNSLVLGLSIPLPIFDRNQGNIAEARYLVSKAAAEKRSVEVAVYSGLVGAREGAAIAFDEVQVFRGEVLIKATETFEKTQRGYEQGKFSYLEVLDSQRTLFDLRTAFLDALRRYQMGNIEIERLTGEALSQRAPEKDTHDEE